MRVPDEPLARISRHAQDEHDHVTLLSLEGVRGIDHDLLAGLSGVSEP